MERRALIGMALMLLIILFYWALFPGQKAPQQPAVEQGGEAGGGAPAGGLAGVQPQGQAAMEDTMAASLAGSGFEIERGAGKEISVETPLYAARFSTRGGVLTSLRLKQYAGAGGEPVEIVPAATEFPFDLVLLTNAGERIDLAEAAFTASSDHVVLAPGTDASLGFTLTTSDGLEIGKIFRFESNDYLITADLSVQGPGSSSIRALEFGWQSGLAPTEANAKDDLRNFAALTLTDGTVVKSTPGKVLKNERISVAGAIAWSGLRSKYFFVGFVPLGTEPILARNFPGVAGAIGMAMDAERAGDQPVRFMIYAGPLDYQKLQKLGRGLDKAVDFGWKWLSPLSKLIFWFMLMCHRVVPNYGWVIIILSAAIKFAFQPLTAKSMRSMREMQKLQPEIQALREKYKKEPQKMNTAMMELYRKRGINPLGGCLPLVLQMPVFFALFNVLSKTIELRRAKFIFWIKDLSAPDVVAKLPFSLPFIGSNLSLLPILMGVAMYIQQKMTPTDPKQAAMTYFLPIIFTLMFFRFPSGLVLYWLVNNVLTIVHQYLMDRADKRKSEAVQAA
jgi:YidC/Oxa1 family membrane protein insertase